MNLHLPAIGCVLSLAIFGAACSNDTVVYAQGRTGPSAGKQSGYYPVTLTSETNLPAEIDRITVGGVNAIGIARIDDRSVRFEVQGAPRSGPADIVVYGGASTMVFPHVFTYTPALHKLFERYYNIGASLTEGAQNASLMSHGQRMTSGAQIARAAGAFFPIPLVVDGLLPANTIDDTGPPPACQVGDALAHLGDNIQKIQTTLRPDGKGHLDLALARQDPGTPTHNYAVGGFRVDNFVLGPTDPGQFLLENFNRRPYVGVAEALLTFPLEPQAFSLDQVDPTLVLALDMIFNDVGLGLYNEFDVAKMTPLPDYTRWIRQIMDSLGKLKGEVFLTNAPSPRGLARGVDEKHELLAQGYSEAEIEARIENMDQRLIEMNRIMTEAASPYRNIHIVDLRPGLQAIIDGKLVVAGRVMTLRKFGGLMSFDHLHFSDTGYAYLANLLLDAIELKLGVVVPRIDLEQVYAQDPFRPELVVDRNPDDCW